MTNRKEIFCRRCKSKLGTADHDDFYLVGQRRPTQESVFLCPVCSWKKTWNFENNPKSKKKRFISLNLRANKALYGIKVISELERGSFEEERRLHWELERGMEIEDDRD